MARDGLCEKRRAATARVPITELEPVIGPIAAETAGAATWHYGGNLKAMEFIQVAAGAVLDVLYYAE